MAGRALAGIDGLLLTGPNSKLGGYDIPFVEGAGAVSYEIDSLPLVPGDYLITAAVYDYSCRHPYDHHERMYRLAVVPGSAARDLDGVVSFPARWSHQPSPPTDGRAEPVALRGS